MDPAARNVVLVSALLKARGARGARQEEIRTLTQWASETLAETDQLALLAKRVRLRKVEAPPARQLAAQVSQLLLDGILSGRYWVDVEESGELVFGGVGVGSGEATVDAQQP